MQYCSNQFYSGTRFLSTESRNYSISWWIPSKIIASFTWPFLLVTLFSKIINHGHVYNDLYTFCWLVLGKGDNYLSPGPYKIISIFRDQSNKKKFSKILLNTSLFNFLVKHYGLSQVKWLFFSAGKGICLL